jgi:hypothetical protein
MTITTKIIGWAIIAVFCWWAFAAADASGERCIAAHNTFAHCRNWGIFW